MVSEFFISLFVSLVNTAISGLGVLTLPFDVAKVLSTITGYGAYVVGADLLIIVGTCIAFWYMVRFTLGIIIFLWRLLPFT